MLEVMRKTMVKNLAETKTAEKNGDDRLLAASVHAIKGVLLNLGLSEWAEKAQKIETTVKESRGESCLDSLASLRKNIEQHLL